MHRSSDAIGSIAGALAKAQVELANPEKSLTATIWSPAPGEGERTFRYAPLSSGLDMVRKCLCKHEIAVVQTTSIDLEAAMVRLETMLAHASGEWIASDWPVCPVNELASPQRMGAALSYARRYALFSIAGIAGEDDLDALDQDIGRHGASAPNASQNGSGPWSGSVKSTVRSAVGLKPLLAPGRFAELRNQLVAELATLTSEDDLVSWAHRSLPAKNVLRSDDARIVEVAYQDKLSGSNDAVADLPGTDKPTIAAPSPKMANEAGAVPLSDSAGSMRPSGHDQSTADMAQNAVPGRIDKSQLAIGAPKRHRSKAHLKFVASRSCLICGRQPSDPYHVRFAQPRGIGLKVSDESRCRYAVFITVRFIKVATNAIGGSSTTSMLSNVQRSYGSKA